MITRSSRTRCGRCESPSRAVESTSRRVVIDANYVRLRAEHAGYRTDRVYTITVTPVDAAGNSTSASTTVIVLHDSGNT
jgi:hypothetical protein